VWDFLLLHVPLEGTSPQNSVLLHDLCRRFGEPQLSCVTSLHGDASTHPCLQCPLHQLLSWQCLKCSISSVSTWFLLALFTCRSEHCAENPCTYLYSKLQCLGRTHQDTPPALTTTHPVEHLPTMHSAEVWSAYHIPLVTEHFLRLFADKSIKYAARKVSKVCVLLAS
jgi:hypothetical protein